MATPRSSGRALFRGEIVGQALLDAMIRPRNRMEGTDYGLGFWLEQGGDVVAHLGTL